MRTPTAVRRSAQALMFQGTGSDVGKSTLVAGLCRIAQRRGIDVAPFKPQNMSNNAAACVGGGEIGRAQALQARAAGLEPHVDLNPVLLKPQSDRTAQVVVHGRVLDTLSASDYMNRRRHQLLAAVTDSFRRLCQQHELVLVEGAGSASEVNLRERDIANMGFARAAAVPVCLIGDIDRGGVIAAVVGTRAVIEADDAALIRSFIINRFRGDPDLFTDGVKAIEQNTGWPCRGVVPWLPAALKLPQEDAVVLERQSPALNTRSLIRIAVPLLSRIANFDDLDPLRLEPNVELGFVPPGSVIPADVDAIILPGTKSTAADMAFLVEQGWDHDIIAAARRGVRVTGICGGYQLLGHWLNDPDGIEGPAGSVRGLGLLEVETRMQSEKRTEVVRGRCLRSDSAVSGYEIRVGVTHGADTERPMFVVDEQPDGALSMNGQVEGTYLHGIYANNDFRRWWLNSLRAGGAAGLDYDAVMERDLDALADGLEQSLDIDALLADARAVDL